MIRVVAIDDHPVILKLLTEDLSKHPDIELVGTAKHGSKLFELVQEKSPDVVILDLGMTEGEFEPISAVRQLHQTYPNVQILIFTGYNNSSYMRELTAAGANGYVLKNDDLSLALPEAVQAIYAGKHYYSKKVMETLISRDKSSGQLSSREIQVMLLVVKGLNNNMIADALSISENRVRNIMSHIYEKLEIQDDGINLRATLIRKAHEMGLLLE